MATALQQVERLFRDQRLPEYAAAQLPDPVENRARQVFVTDIGMVAVSNGTAWVRLDTGATL